MTRATLLLLATVALVAWATPAKAAINLGTAGNYAVLGGQTVTNTGPTVINGGNVGVSPGSSITGFPPGTVMLPFTIDNLNAPQAQIDLTAAYIQAAGLAFTTDLSGQDLGSVGILTPGVYFFSSSAQLTGALTLDFLGNPDAEFVFQIGSTLTTASGSSVNFINTGNSLTPGCEVFWQVGSSADLFTTTAFKGHILALTSINLQTGATLDGSALARNGAVTLDSNIITNSICAADEGGNGGVVPEPGSFVIFGSLLAGLFGFRKRFLSAA